MYESPSSGVRPSLAASVVDANHRSSMPPRLSPNLVQIIRMQFQSSARLQERARNPVGCKAKYAPVGFECICEGRIDRWTCARVVPKVAIHA